MMPIEQAEGADRAKVTHLEAVGRLAERHRAVARMPAGLTGDEGAIAGRIPDAREHGARRGLDPVVS